MWMRTKLGRSQDEGNQFCELRLDVIFVEIVWNKNDPVLSVACWIIIICIWKEIRTLSSISCTKWWTPWTNKITTMLCTLLDLHFISCCYCCFCRLVKHLFNYCLLAGGPEPHSLIKHWLIDLLNTRWLTQYSLTDWFINRWLTDWFTTEWLTVWLTTQLLIDGLITQKLTESLFIDLLTHYSMTDWRTHYSMTDWGIHYSMTYWQTHYSMIDWVTSHWLTDSLTH